jgi:DNA primase
MVNQNLQIYKCFGCGESGDVITFVEKIEGVDFKGALRILADKYNIKLSEEKVSENDILKKRIYEINNLTLEFFNHLLLNHSAGKVGLDYLLSKRNLKKETIEEFKLGYAPKDWSTLCDFLKKRGFTESEIIASNLGIAKKTGGVYDKFRGRVVFPYYSLDGKVIGFMGRTIFDEDPKYLNSSDTAVFKKGEFLYGLYKTKLDIKKNGAVIVEGTMDFLKPYQNGFKNLVATSGTALTNQQLEILKRYTDKIFFCFDTDNAGINAILRGIEISDKYNFDVKVISIPKKFKDLDEYFDIEPENAIDLSSNAIDINDFLLAQLYRKYDYSTATGKRKIVDDFKLYYSRIENGILKNHYVKKLAEDLELEESVIRKSLTTDVPTELPKKYSNNQEKTYENPLKALESTKEYLFLALLVRSSLDIVKPIVLKFPDDCFLNLELKDLYRKFKVYLQNLGDKINIQIFSKDLNSDEKNLLEGLMLYEARGDFNSIDKTIEELEKLANFLKEDYKKSRIKEISDQIKKAEKEKNLDQVKILMEELSKFLK